MEISLRNEVWNPQLPTNGTESAHIVPFPSADDHRILALPTISHDTTLQRAMLVSVVERVHSADFFYSCGSTENC